MSLLTIIIPLTCYLIGALPTGRIIAKIRGVNLERVGSGNVGATNVARSVGSGAGLLTLLGDIGKGAAAAFLGSLYFTQFSIFTDFLPIRDLFGFEINLSAESGAAVGGMMAVFGHCFSIPRVWKGGKGVATGLGAVTVVAPSLTVAAICTFLALFLLTKRVSVGSIGSAIAVPFTAVLTGFSHLTLLAITVIALIIIQRHHGNIARIMKGVEPKFSIRKG